MKRLLLGPESTHSRLVEIQIARLSDCFERVVEFGVPSPLEQAPSLVIG